MSRRRAAAIAAMIAACCLARPAQAAEIRLLSAAAMQTVFHLITDEFERTSGHSLVFAYTTMGAITERVLAGETADLIIGSTQSLERLAKVGLIDPASLATIPFPPGLQNYTSVAVGTPAGAAPSAAVKALVAFLHGPSAAAAIKARGMEVE